LEPAVGLRIVVHRGYCLFLICTVRGRFSSLADFGTAIR
jgi:hypothetical protein